MFCNSVVVILFPSVMHHVAGTAIEDAQMCNANTLEEKNDRLPPIPPTYFPLSGKNKALIQYLGLIPERTFPPKNRKDRDIFGTTWDIPFKFLHLAILITIQLMIIHVSQSRSRPPGDPYLLSTASPAHSERKRSNKKLSPSANPNPKEVSCPVPEQCQFSFQYPWDDHMEDVVKEKLKRCADESDLGAVLKFMKDKHFIEVVYPGEDTPVTYQQEQFIAEGGSGVVFRYSEIGNPANSIALKACHSDYAYTTEIAYHASFSNCPNVAKFRGWFEFCEHQFVLMDYYSQDAQDAIANEKPLSEKQVLSVLLQIGSAIKELHSRNILHGDLKPDNILLDKEGNAFLTDFGHSTQLKKGEKISEICGTTRFSAPEVPMSESCVGKPSKYYDLKADIFALGIVLRHLLFANDGYRVRSEADVGQSLLPKNSVVRGLFVSQEMREIVEDMLWKEPEKRPTIDEILQRALPLKGCAA